MKKQTRQQEEGSLLLMALITITILTLICATSLYVTSQDANATTQTTSWQQAMAGAEAAVDQAMNAVNTSTWTGWYTITGSSLPIGQPSPSGTPFPSGGGAMPTAGQYNYYSSSFTLQGEASNSVSMWVTVDNGSITPVSSGLVNGANAQAYRIRATATVNAPGPRRVSNNKLDNDLRHISLMFNRLTGTANTTSHGQATRRIELVAVPVAQNLFARALTLKSGIQMSGGAYVDSFNSGNPFESTSGLYDSSKRQTNGDIGLASNSTNSDLRSTYVYGSLQYSGTAVKNTSNVQGGISTPFNATIPATVDPVPSATAAWAQTDAVPQYSTSQQTNVPAFQTTGGIPNYTSYTTSGGNPPTTSPALTFTAAGSSNSPSSPTLIKVNGDFTTSGSTTFNIKSPSSGSGPYYVAIWVTGQFTTSGSSQVVQDPNVKVTWIIDGNITASGSSYVNQSGLAANTSFIGVGTGKTITDSGSAAFIGTINAPGYDMTISGSGAFDGSAVANSINISGSGGFHYDEALAGSSTVANFAYASWFEDNSDPARSVTY